MTPDCDDEHSVSTVTAAHRKAHGRERMTARPAVLRALTDLFCLREDPIAEEIERYRELALQIIPDAGPSTRLYVAAKLARHPMAPRDVLEKLAENDPPCATLLLEHARNFPVEAQVEAARNGDRATAVALASRPDLESPVSEALVARNDPHVTRALAENPNAKLTPATADAVQDERRPDRIYAPKLKAKATKAAAPELFLNASAEERAGVIAAARRASLGRASAPVLRDETLLAELLDTAIDRKWDRFASALSRKTGLGVETVSRLVRDPGGERLALLLSLVGATQSEAIRILLCCDTPIAHSYPRVRDLSFITTDTPATVAGALVFGMTGARPRISTYAGAPERSSHTAAEGIRAGEEWAARAKDAQASKAKVVLRRRIP
ncbi:MAG: DUF2336 domain-containing protein [Beijerinckiaceae bacterium]